MCCTPPMAHGEALPERTILPEYSLIFACRPWLRGMAGACISTMRARLPSILSGLENMRCSQVIYLCDSSRVIVRTVNDLIKSPMSLKRQRTTRKHPFPNPKNLGGGNLKKCKVRFLLAGRSGQVCPLGGWAELRHFAGNRFELRCINEPCKNRPRGPDFTWLGKRDSNDRCNNLLI